MISSEILVISKLHFFLLNFQLTLLVSITKSLDPTEILTSPSIFKTSRMVRTAHGFKWPLLSRKNDLCFPVTNWHATFLKIYLLSRNRVRWTRTAILSSSTYNQELMHHPILMHAYLNFNEDMHHCNVQELRVLKCHKCISHWEVMRLQTFMFGLTGW